MTSRERPITRNPLRITLSSRPRGLPDVQIRDYEYNVLLIIKKIRENRYTFAKEATTLAYVPGETTLAVYLDSLAKWLVPLCNGRRRVKDLLKGIDKSLSVMKRQKVKNMVLERLRYLGKYGIIG